VAPPARRGSCGQSCLGSGRCARGLDLGQDLGGLVKPAGEFGRGGRQFVGVVVAGPAERGEEVYGPAGRAGVEGRPSGAVPASAVSIRTLQLLGGWKPTVLLWPFRAPAWRAARQRAARSRRRGRQTADEVPVGHRATRSSSARARTAGLRSLAGTRSTLAPRMAYRSAWTRPKPSRPICGGRSASRSTSLAAARDSAAGHERAFPRKRLVNFCTKRFRGDVAA
jgi:hypothetical protein